MTVSSDANAYSPSLVDIVYISYFEHWIILVKIFLNLNNRQIFPTGHR